MGAISSIEWTATIDADGSVTPGATWNPVRARNLETGRVGHYCVKVSPGCTACYAERFNLQGRGKNGTKLAYTVGNLEKLELFLDEKTLTAPLRWRKPRKIFVGSMTDLFGEFVPDEWLDRIFAVMVQAPQHVFQVLTKRARRMQDYSATMLGLPPRERALRMVRSMYRGHPSERLVAGSLSEKSTGTVQWPLHNLWMGVSCEDQQRLDERVPDLLATPAAVRFLSLEPLLGPLDLTAFFPRSIETGPFRWKRGIDWCIAGGESGPGARPMHPEWARSIRDQCQAAGVAYFFKQWGEWALAYHRTGVYAIVDPRDGIVGGPTKERPRSFALFGNALMRRVGKKAAGRELDGRTWSEFPEVRR